MGIIHQPTPSNPKSPQPESRPLEPGQSPSARNTEADPKRPNIQTPDTQREKSGER